MVKIERIYRIRRQALFGVFICSVIFLALFLTRPILLQIFPVYERHENFWINLWYAIGLTALLICLGLVARYLHLRISLKKDRSLIQAVDDERIRISWLKAYRFAFYLMIGIHCLVVFGLYDTIIIKTGLPVAEWLSLAVALAALFGAALYFSREGSHE